MQSVGASESERSDIIEKLMESCMRGCALCRSAGDRTDFGNRGGTPRPTEWAWRTSERVEHIINARHALRFAQGRTTPRQLPDHAIKYECNRVNENN